MFQIIGFNIVFVLIKVLVLVEKVQVSVLVNIFQKPVADIVADQSFLDVLPHLVLFPRLFQQLFLLLDKGQLLLDLLVLMFPLSFHSVVVRRLVLLNAGELFLLLDLKSCLNYLSKMYCLKCFDDQNVQDGSHFLVEVEQLILLDLSRYVDACLLWHVWIFRWTRLELVCLDLDVHFRLLLALWIF